MSHPQFAHVLVPPEWRKRALMMGVLVVLLVWIIGVAMLSVGQRPKLGAGAATAKGQFLIQCHGPVLSAPFDPIVHPGDPAPAGQHNHEFFANKSINASSTWAQLVKAPTACDESGDTAAYWVPTLYVNGQRAPAKRLTAYYSSDGNNPNGLETWTPGLKIIAGNSHATAPQDTKVVYWGCGNGSGQSGLASPPQCGSGQLTVHVRFPDCSTGASDSADHKSHMAYSSGGNCPTGFPHHFPYLIMRFEYGITPDPKALTLSSGSVNTMHGDWLNSWSYLRLDEITKHCISGGNAHSCSAAESLALPPTAPK